MAELDDGAVYKVNEFERDLGTDTYRNIQTDPEANINYVYNGDDILDDLPALREFILHHHEHQKPRLELLHSYYEGKNATILSGKRRKEKENADHRASHPFAEYISDFTNGYFLGKDITVEHEDAKDALEPVHNYNDIHSLNREIGLDLSIYGRAYELAMKNHKDEYRFYRSRPEETFVIYDNTIEENSLVAVRYYPEDVSVTKDSVYLVDVYGTEEVHRLQMHMTTQSNLTVRDTPYPHPFQRVPITEYKNNRDRRGDFEKVIPQIDLYDAAQSDTANYMTDINDALLVLMGNLAIDGEEAQKQKEANVLILEPPEYPDNSTGNVKEGNIDAKYIYKQYDVAGSEAYKDRLESNIHLLTNTPHMADENFSGTQSGEAMKYKLFGLEQKTVIKEGMFIKGLRRRYKLLQTIMQTDRELDTTVDLKEIHFTFVRNLPKSLIEDLKSFTEAGGQLSKETLITLFALVPDAEKELTKIDEERQLPEYDFEMPVEGDGDA